MRKYSLLSATVAGLVAGFMQLGTANAGTIATPILFLSNNTTQVLCTANNLGPAITVTVRIIGVVSGGAVDTCNLVANDRGGCQVPFFGAGQCRISVTGLTNDEVRDRIRGVMITRPITAPFAIEAVVQAN